MMYIPEDKVQLIQQQARVTDVLGDFLSLKKRGTKYLCPFHEDHIPSFSISSSDKFYRCFGCDAKGTATSFLLTQQQMSFPEAMCHLASKYSIPLELSPRTNKQKKKQKTYESLYIILEAAKKYFVSIINDSSRKKGLEYLKKRKLDSNLILKNFNLGMSLPTWADLTNNLKNNGYEVSLLQQAGLTLRSNKEGINYYDRFRDRLIFPLQDMGGRVVGFAGRSLAPANPTTPKYINTPETLLYQKSRYLYGLSQAKKAIKESQNCYLVEGYSDVLSLHQVGLSQVVASGGTAITKQQVCLLKGLTNKITVLFDGDSAGKKATLRAINILFSEGFDVEVVLLPSNQDPDSYRQKVSNEEFKDYLLKKSVKGVDFCLQEVLSINIDNISQRTDAIYKLVETISQTPDLIKRNLQISYCSKALNIEENILLNVINKKKTPQLFSTKKQVTFNSNSNNAKSSISSIEKAILHLLIFQGYSSTNRDIQIVDLLLRVLDKKTFQNLDCRDLIDVFLTNWKDGTRKYGNDFIEHYRIQLGDKLFAIIKNLQNYYPHKPSPNWGKKFVTLFKEEDVDDIIKLVKTNLYHLKLKILQKEIEKSRNKISNLENNSNLEALELVEINEALKKKQRLIADKLGIVILPFKNIF